MAILSCAVILGGCGASHAEALSASVDARAVHRMEYAEASAASEESAALDQMAPPDALLPAAPHRAKMDGDADPADTGEADVAQSLDEFQREPARGRRPLLIYRADLGLGVFRVQQNLDAIEEMAVDAGGYLVSRGESQLMVRVPAADFERTVEAILQMGDVHRREIHAQDVTSEYTDLQIRLKNALAMRQRLEELLHKAVDVKEALKVEEQLGRVSEQIEVMKGRLKMLRELASFSTISVEFSERSAPIDSRVELPFEFLDEIGLTTLLNL